MLRVVERAMFPRPQPSYTAESFPDELIWIPRNLAPSDPDLPAQEQESDDSVPCLLLECRYSRFVLLYFHSNAEDIGNCRNFCNSLKLQFAVTVLAVEYPGYGICPGEPCEASVTQNARLVMEFAQHVLGFPLDCILLLGRSIGCGPALSIASQLPLGGVILVCPFKSVKELVKHNAGSFIADLIGERFPNQELVKKVVAPVLIVHGLKDKVVPCSHGQALYSLCVSRKRLVCPREMEHNSNILTEPNHFVFPAMHFFSLPDFNFEQMRVPDWVRRSATKGGDAAEESAAELDAALARELCISVDVDSVAERFSLLSGAGAAARCAPADPGDDPPEPPEDQGYRKVPPSCRSLSASFRS
eukprot:TRINITY_DN4973_c1_g2_i1.p1 TRINITY_DN4973_c1_g2~~TRINITY_DN4973_c1_g2_i1.p1  ORF type:complete len:359 (+),score=85.44 TRINITY_DN4973_c1_g2_i1:191-1267(+)